MANSFVIVVGVTCSVVEKRHFTLKTKPVIKKHFWILLLSPQLELHPLQFLIKKWRLWSNIWDTFYRENSHAHLSSGISCQQSHDPLGCLSVMTALHDDAKRYPFILIPTSRHQFALGIASIESIYVRITWSHVPMDGRDPQALTNSRAKRSSSRPFLIFLE